MSSGLDSDSSDEESCAFVGRGIDCDCYTPGNINKKSETCSN